VEWEKRAGYCSCNDKAPNQKAMEVPLPIVTLETVLKDSRPATMFFQMGVSRKSETPKSRVEDQPYHRRNQLAQRRREKHAV
jgi:hypothetical protein